MPKIDLILELSLAEELGQVENETSSELGFILDNFN